MVQSQPANQLVQTHLFTSNVVTRSSAQHLQKCPGSMARRNTSLILLASKGNLEPKHWNIPHKRNYLQPKQQWVGQHSYKYTPPTLNVDLSCETLAGAPSSCFALDKHKSVPSRVTYFTLDPSQAQRSCRIVKLVAAHSDGSEGSHECYHKPREYPRRPSYP